MLVVSDTTPLIALLKSAHLGLLKELFDEILIPRAVFNELTRNANFSNEAFTIQNASYIRVVDVEDLHTVDILRRATGLDQGESEAIVYAEFSKADILLMDERKGRRVAISMGLPIMGSVGVLLQAQKSGLITAGELKDALLMMKESGIRLSAGMIEKVLRRADEK